MFSLCFRSIHPVKYYRDFLVSQMIYSTMLFISYHFGFTQWFDSQAHDVRPDGRTPEKTRSVTVNVKSINTADGSAIVRIGNTTVVCGIKAVSTVPLF